jgi:phospholipid-binding lipoprotein MlaA
MPTPVRSFLLAVCLLCLGGCALPPGAKPDPRDPWERMNRATWKFNDGFDHYVFKPAASGYTKAVPRFARTGIHNFFSNLGYPIVILNDLLQWQITAFGSDIGRFLMNSTAGIGGLFDPATAVGLEKNDREFGQTLGVWGVKPGPYLMLPLMGPSDVRDTGGLLVDQVTDPRNYLFGRWVSWSLYIISSMDRRAQLLGSTDRALEGAYDKYAFLRSAYLQNREFKVHGEQSTNEEEQERKLLEEMGDDDTTGAAPDKAAPPVEPSSTPPPSPAPSPRPTPPAEPAPSPH